jgi:2-polyprenyl-6-methoxyphenol hydroxylase-like FAD-dependent oxidoreductase
MSADVLIVGGGIGGAVLAELLGRTGRKVVVLEKSTERPQWTRPEILWPPTVKLLFSLRRREDWEREAMLPLQGFTVFNGQRFVSVVSRQTFDDAQVQPWSTDPNLTRELLLTSPSFELRRGVEVTDVLKEKGRVIGARARKIGSVESFDVLATWTVGDDGRDSVVRRACGVETKMRTIPVEAFCFKFDWPAIFPTGCACGFPNFKGGRCGILAWGGPPLPNEKGAGIIGVFGTKFNACQSPEQAWAEVRAIHPVIDEVVGSRKFPQDFGHIQNFRWGHAPRYGMPGALVMGDAAHPVSPAGGQGANMSVADAAVLAELLANDSADLLEQYERRRRPANTRSLRPTRVLSFVFSLPAWCRPTSAFFKVVAPFANHAVIKRRGLRFVSTAFQERLQH